MGFDVFAALSSMVFGLSVIGVIVAIVFALRRYRETPQEYRFATYPTILIALTLVFYAVASITDMLSTIFATADLHLRLAVAMALIAGFTLTLSAFTASGRVSYSVPFIIPLAVGQWFVWTSPIIALTTFFPPIMISWVLLNITPVCLFGYIWMKTRRTSVFGVFIGFLFLIFGALLRGVSGAYPSLSGVLWLMVSILWLSALSLIIVCFLFPARPYRWGLLGYTGTIVVVALELVWVLMFWDSPFVDITFATTMVLSAGFASVGASYTLERFLHRRFLTTGLIWAFFTTTAFSAYTRVITEFLHFFGLYLGTISWALTLLAGAFMAASAFNAMERKTAVLLPFVPVVPAIVSALFLWPDLADNWWITMPRTLLYFGALVVGAIFLIIPIVMYVMLGRRLAPELGTGRARAFGLALGLIVSVPSVINALPALVRGGAAVLGTLILVLAVTGTLDRLLYRKKAKH
jgi:hypothetical protein